MTISYAGNFAKLLLRWKGSIWKSVWRELIGFLTLYYLVRLLYKLVLSRYETPKENFEYCCQNFDEYTKRIPLTFLLGFYVSTVVKRWWDQFELIAWPEDLLSLVCLALPGEDRDSRLKRHSIARYVNLTAALAWRDVSIKVRKRFPTIGHLVQCGLMTDEEYLLYQSIQVETVRWFLPIQWSQKILSRLIEKREIAPPIAASLAQEIKLYRQSFRKIYCYDWVCIPLVYTQVAALATYAYFGFCLFGRQFLDPLKKYQRYEVDLFVPVFTIIQFLFFVGWFKVGQDLMRPFGTDDDDIELNYILDRHIQASFSLVDKVNSQEPPVVEDRFWSELPPKNLPHTKLSSKISDHPPKLHAWVRYKHDDDGDYTEPLIVNENRESKKRWRYF